MSQYVPKPDPKGINSSPDQNLIKDSLILLAGFLGVLGILYFILIGISDWALTKIGVEQEIRWFSKISEFKNKETQNPKDFDELLSKIKPHVPFDLKVGILCSREINAAAFPGGRIMLTAGLLENIKSENGLVFVLGHEVGHVMNRDHIRGLGRQIIFALGAGMLGFDQVSGLTMLNQSLSRVYDRQQETDADTYGLALNQKLYGHAWGADELFEILEKEESVLGQSIARLASTHPPSADRRARINSLQVGASPLLALPARPYKDWIKEFNCAD